MNQKYKHETKDRKILELLFQRLDSLVEEKDKDNVKNNIRLVNNKGYDLCYETIRTYMKVVRYSVTKDG